MTPLPAPVARFRDVIAGRGSPRVGTVLIDASAWMRRPGIPRIPLDFRMAHRLGRDFVHEIRIGRRPLTVPMGLDAYVDGHGLMRIGRTVHAGPTFDQGALIALWGEALTFPAAWDRRDDVRWDPVDERTATLVVAGPEGELPIGVGFDQRTGLPRWCEADRYKADGPKVRWRGTFGDWRPFDRGVVAPGRFTASWADEPFPWLELRVRRLRVDAPVDAMLAVGRRAIAAAGAAARVRPGSSIPVLDGEVSR
jgi:hypothetical protein